MSEEKKKKVRGPGKKRDTLPGDPEQPITKTQSVVKAPTGAVALVRHQTLRKNNISIPPGATPAPVSNKQFEQVVLEDYLDQLDEQKKRDAE